MESLDIPAEEFTQLRMALPVGLKPHDVRAIGRKHFDGTPELLDLVMGTIVTGLRQSREECLYNEILRREVNTSVIEAAQYFRSEDIPTGPTPVIILVGRWSLGKSSLESDSSSHSFGYHETIVSLRG